MQTPRNFWFLFLGSWIIYFLLLPTVAYFKIYEVFAAIGVLGYGAMILLNLIAINFCEKRLDYILTSISLIAIGAVAATDMIINKYSMIQIWMEQVPSLTEELATDYLQILIILLNIFTGSIAAQSLFHGLNKRTFFHDYSD